MRNVWVSHKWCENNGVSIPGSMGFCQYPRKSNEGTQHTVDSKPLYYFIWGKQSRLSSGLFPDSVLSDHSSWYSGTICRAGDQTPVYFMQGQNLTPFIIINLVFKPLLSNCIIENMQSIKLFFLAFIRTPPTLSLLPLDRSSEHLITFTSF